MPATGDKKYKRILLKLSGEELMGEDEKELGRGHGCSESESRFPAPAEARSREVPTPRVRHDGLPRFAPLPGP